MRIALVVAVGVALIAALVGRGFAGDEPAATAPPDPAAVATTALAKVDEALFFPDAQPGLLGYEAEVTVAAGSQGPVPAGFLKVDCVAGTRRWTDAEGKDVEAGGVGTTSPVHRRLVNLLSTPLSRQFDSERWNRAAVAVPGGWAVTLVRKSANLDAWDMALRVGENGVPSAVLLRSEVAGFVNPIFKGEGTRKRIEHASTAAAPLGSALAVEWVQDTGFAFLGTLRWSGEPDLFGSKPDPAAGWPMKGAFTLRLGPYKVKMAEAPPPPPPTPTGTYLGDAACKKCHMKQYLSWRKTRLAKSLDSLRPVEEAKDAETFAARKAAGLDPAKDFSTDPKCVACHVTGYGLAGGYPKDPAADDAAKDAASRTGSVGCESCHGPGDEYVKYKRGLPAGTKPRPEDLYAHGLAKPDEASCLRCHNAESPTNKPFVYADAKTKVHDHPK